MKGNTAILVIGYNRVEKLAKCLEYIESVSSNRNIYIALDGPKGTSIDLAKVESCRRVVSKAKVKMESCTVYFGKENRGCREFMMESITWVARKEEFFIVVEDDVVITKSFVGICDQVKKTDSSSRFSVLCGCTYEDKLGQQSRDIDWFYTYLVNVWGWAVNSRVWEDFLLWSNGKTDIAKTAITLGKRLGLRKSIHVLTCFIYSKRGRINTWDYDFGTFVILGSIKCYSPIKALTTNFGFDLEATHTRNEEPDGLVCTKKVLENSKELAVSINGLEEAFFAKSYQRKMTINIPFRDEYFTQALKGITNLILMWILKRVWKA